MEKVAVLDYGSSNLRSVVKALEHVAEGKVQILIATEAGQLMAADRIVFPGQGAIGQCMQNLIGKGFKDALLECIREKPFLGLCLGLQSLLDESAEDGDTAGLGIIPGKVIRFADDAKDCQGNLFKVPHMGWNRVKPTRQHPLWRDIEPGTRFYFVHSYYVSPNQADDIASSTDYTLEFTSAIARDNLFAVQFHPEKSQHSGLTLLKNFLHWQP